MPALTQPEKYFAIHLVYLPLRPLCLLVSRVFLFVDAFTQRQQLAGRLTPSAGLPKSRLVPLQSRQLI